MSGSASAPNSANLNAVAFTPGGTGVAWAAGYRDSGSSLHPMILRWQGHAWSIASSPASLAQLNGLGFASASYFSVVFHEKAGATPQRFRDGFRNRSAGL